MWRLKPKEAASYVNFKDKPGTITNKLAIAAKSMQRAQSRENLVGLREDKGAGPAPTRPPSRRLAGQDPVGELAVWVSALCWPVLHQHCAPQEGGALVCRQACCPVVSGVRGSCWWIICSMGVLAGLSITRG